MGNTTQCGFSFSLTSNHQYQLMGRQNHFLYGQIQHFKGQNLQKERFAVKKMKFKSQIQLQKYRSSISAYQQMCKVLPLIKLEEFKETTAGQKGQKVQIDEQYNCQPIFECNRQNFIFKSATEQFSCSDPQDHPLVLNLEYIQEKQSLKQIVQQRSKTLKKFLQNNKVNQNVLLQLQNKLKLCEYDKIDRLPHKQRSLVNIFFNQIEVLRMFDYMITALYGLKIYGLHVDTVRPEFFFKQKIDQKINYFYPQAVNANSNGNIQKTLLDLQTWIVEEDAKFHHNWSLKQKQLISYVHPEQLSKLTQSLASKESNNFFNSNIQLSKRETQRQNIYSLAIIILQICLLEPCICSKIYHISTFKQIQKTFKPKKQIKCSFQKQNLIIKLNQTVLKRYLIQMKAKYSNKFVELVQTMIFGQTLLKSQTVDHQKQIKYQQIIQILNGLIQQNANNLKQVYNSSEKSKSKSRNGTSKNQRKSSLSRQASVTGVINPSLSSGQSFSMLPRHSHQRVLSMDLLRKQCEKVQNKSQKILVKSQIQVLQQQFSKNKLKLEQNIMKDQRRILEQLNSLNQDYPVGQKQTRFNYRKIHLKEPTPNNKNLEVLSNQAETKFQFQFTKQQKYVKTYTNSSDISKCQKPSNQKERRINSIAKIKKIQLQKARQEQAMGSTLSHTIPIDQSGAVNLQDQRQMYNSKQAITRNDAQGISRNAVQGITRNDCQGITRNDAQGISKNTRTPQIEPFFEDHLNSTSQLKDLMRINIINVSKEWQNRVSRYQKSPQESPKELKSSQLYEIYMKEYKILAKQQTTGGF